ncbi:MAG TPA: putative glycoside hydrolase, partial [Terriglobia bacterium]|nr:putative glycoside hydrolase [Terriglobia bacterium]
SALKEAPAKHADSGSQPGSRDEVAAGRGEPTTAAAAHESKPADPQLGASGPDLGPTYEVKGKQSVTAVARMYVTRTTFMTVADLEAAIRSANGGKTDANFKKGDHVVIPGFLTEPIVEKPVAIAPDAEMRGIYLTGYTAGSAKGIELIRRWRAAGGNAVVFDIKDFDGLVNVPFRHPLTSTRRPLISNLPKFARFLHSQGLHSIGRIALFRDAYQAENHSRLAVRSRRSGKPWLENGKLAWVDPSNPEAQSYLLDLAKMAASCGLDEIQFDYVRFPAEGDQKDAEFAYEAVHPKWQRSDVIVNFLDRAYRELHPLGVLLSLDVFGVMAWQRSVDLAHTGQDIAAMAHHCDILSPMIYPSHFFNMDGYKRPGDYPEHFISESMERFRAITTDSKVVLRPWLQAFAWRTPTYSPAYIVVQVGTSNQKGGVGYLFWNARNDYSKLFPAMPRLRSDSGPKNAAMAPPGRSASHATDGDREAPHAGPSEP